MLYIYIVNLSGAGYGFAHVLLQVIFPIVVMSEKSKSLQITKTAEESIVSIKSNYVFNMIKFISAIVFCYMSVMVSDRANKQEKQLVDIALGRRSKLN